MNEDVWEKCRADRGSPVCTLDPETMEPDCLYLPHVSTSTWKAKIHQQIPANGSNIFDVCCVLQSNLTHQYCVGWGGGVVVMSHIYVSLSVWYLNNKYHYSQSKIGPQQNLRWAHLCPTLTLSHNRKFWQPACSQDRTRNTTERLEYLPWSVVRETFLVPALFSQAY